MRIYISGKMTGMPDHNIPAFNAAAKRLREQGHFVINPAELSALFGTPEEIADSFAVLYNAHYRDNPILARQVGIAKSILDADLAAVRSCDAIYLLRGWEQSRGAKKELAEAIRCGLEVMLEGGEE